MPLEGIEMIGPVAAIPVDPLVNGDQTVGAQRVDAALRVGPDLDEPDLAQDAQVPRHGRLGQPGQRRDQLAGGALTVDECVEQRTPTRFGDRFELDIKCGLPRGHGLR
jgi:hypothetical protein